MNIRFCVKSSLLELYKFQRCLSDQSGRGGAWDGSPQPSCKLQDCISNFDLYCDKMPDKTSFRKAGSLWLHRGGGHEAAGGILSMVRKPQEVNARV